MRISNPQIAMMCFLAGPGREPESVRRASQRGPKGAPDTIGSIRGTSPGKSTIGHVNADHRLARWRAAQEQAQGLERTETLPELSEADVLDIKRRTVQRGEST